MLLPAPAAAQNPAAAEALFEQARAAMAAGDYQVACARLRDSDRLDPAVGTRFNLADCEERRGRLATAWSLFRGVLAELGAEDDRRPIAEQRARALEPRLSYVTLQRAADTPRSARLRLDGVELGEGSFDVPLPLDPGAHELVLMADGKEERRTVTLRERETTVVPIRLEPPRAERPPADESGSARRTSGYVVGGVGIAAALTGIVAGVVTLGKKSTANEHCDDARRVCDQTGRDANESGQTFGVVSGVGLAVGALGLATGAYLLLTAPRAPATASARLTRRDQVTLAPQLGWGTGTGFLGVVGSF
ncbi:MAG: hypothetical protein EOO73_27015 [Myxococcales bacterium]|nr:MAG: hypothetical protein EOO73_27015 [Myxococcales bacterium]